jgi:hypothetical protein
VLVSIQSHPVQVMEYRAINEWNEFEFISWFLCEDHKNVNLCYMICASPFVCLLGYTCCLWICRLNYHLILRGGGLSRCVPFGYNLGVNTHFQVDLLMICVYYSMWNLRWKAMRLHMCFYHYNEPKECDCCSSIWPC